MQPIWSVSSFLPAIGLGISIASPEKNAMQVNGKEVIHCFMFAFLEFLLPKGTLKHTDVLFRFPIYYIFGMVYNSVALALDES